MNELLSDELKFPGDEPYRHARHRRSLACGIVCSILSLPMLCVSFLAGCGDDAHPPGAAGGAGGNGGEAGNSIASLCIDAQPIKVVPPAGLQVRFRALDCDGNAVRPLSAADVSVINDEKGVAFGLGGEGDSVSGVGQNSNIELYSVLALDFSNSITEAGAQDAVIDGAKAFVEETVTKPQTSLKHRVAIIAFGRPDLVTLEQDFTQDDATIYAKLEELRKSPPRGTTDLYHAYMMALDKVGTAGSGGDTVIERFVVVLTDGTHEAGDEENLRQQALAAKHATNATVYTIGIEGNYNACRLEELAGRGMGMAAVGCRELDACVADSAPPASCTQFFPGVNQSAISKAFQDVATRAAGLARSNYVVGICTPVSLGNPTLTLKVDVGGVKDADTLGYAVSNLNGDVNTCDADAIQKGQLLCDAFDACQVVCLNMECGTDLGASCGTCPGSQYCSATNTCLTPCQGMNCGTDQGVDCGTCSPSEYCGPQNVCRLPCAGMQCGTEQGMDCGTCAMGSGCDASNQCVVCSNKVGFTDKVDYPTGTPSSFAATGDLDGDQYPDIVYTSATSKRIYWRYNQGDGTFGSQYVNSSITTISGGIAIADVNGDGKVDIVSAGNGVSVLINEGNKAFGAEILYDAGGYLSAVTALDLSGDGKPELVVAHGGSSETTVAVLPNKGDGTFGAPISYMAGVYPYAIDTADLNGDGKPDLVVANYESDNISVLLNNGDGTFGASVEYAISFYPNSVTAEDLNGDGKADVVATDNTKYVHVFLNQGNGTLAPPVDYDASVSANRPDSVAVADFNSDGKPDLAVVATSSLINSLRILTNQGNGTFAIDGFVSAVNWPRIVRSADFNRDGKPDLAVLNYKDSTVSLLLGKCIVP